MSNKDVRIVGMVFFLILSSIGIGFYLDNPEGGNEKVDCYDRYNNKINGATCTRNVPDPLFALIGSVSLGFVLLIFSFFLAHRLDETDKLFRSY